MQNNYTRKSSKRNCSSSGASDCLICSPTSMRESSEGVRDVNLENKEIKKMISLTKFVSCDGRVLWGWWFLIVGAVSFMGFLYAAVISKLQPPSHNVIIRAVQNDWYYCFLVPLTLPILVVAVYFHWLSMKLFKHA